jgi:hypothetical protein
MSTDNHRMLMPGGAVVVRVDDELSGRRYHVHGAPAVLTVADVELLFADSIAGDGRCELREPADPKLCGGGPTDRCGMPRLHKGICVPRWFCKSMEPFLK